MELASSLKQTLSGLDNRIKGVVERGHRVKRLREEINELVAISQSFQVSAPNKIYITEDRFRQICLNGINTEITNLVNKLQSELEDEL